MSAQKALAAAHAAGVEVRLDGKDLVLSGASTPPTAVIDMLRRHKHSIVELLRQRYLAGTSVPASAGAVAALGAATGGTGSTLVSAPGDIIGSSNIIGSGGISASSAIVALRRPQGDEWSTEDWQAYFDERAAIAEFDGGLCRPEAEERAFNCCVADWLGRNPVYSSSDRCLLCAEADRPNNSLLPVGLAGAGQAWLHRDCVPAWRSARMGAAVEALMAMNIKEGAPSAGIDITGSMAAGAEAASPLISGTEVASSASGAGSAHVAIHRQTQGDKRSIDDWQAFVDQQVRIAEGDGLARPAAEARAFDDAVAEWMLRNPVNSAPGACPLCGEADRPSDPLQFIGIIGARTWLHIGCSTIWVKDRKAEAVAALAEMGIGRPEDSPRLSNPPAKEGAP